MGKYHKSLGIPQDVKIKALDFVRRLSGYRLGFTSHALEALNDELDSIEAIKNAISQYRPSYSEVFEIVEYGQIEKIGFRIPFNNRDIVFIVNSWGKIVTIWTNSKEDNHKTLNIKQYATI